MPLRTHPLQGRPLSHLSLLARQGSQLMAFLARLAGRCWAEEEDDEGAVGDGGECRFKDDGSMAGEANAEWGKCSGTELVDCMMVRGESGECRDSGRREST